MPSPAQNHDGRFGRDMPNDDEIAAYVADLLGSLQKLCQQRNMTTLSHFIGIARAEAVRLAGRH